MKLIAASQSLLREVRIAREWYAAWSEECDDPDRVAGLLKRLEECKAAIAAAESEVG